MDNAHAVHAPAIPRSLFTNIQALRAIAALIVVFIHLSALLRSMGLPVPEGGVDIFFVISGFIMVYTTMTRPATPGHFMVQRVIRVVPLYWIMTFVIFVMAAAAPQLFRNTTANLPDLLKSLFFVPFSKDGSVIRPLLYVGWTLNYEMFFYLIFSIGLFFRNYLHGFLFTVGTIAALTLAGMAWQVDSLFWRFYTDPILLEFAAGMLIAYFTLPIQERDRPVMRRISSIVALIALLVTAFTADFWPEVHRAWAAGIPAVVLILAAVLREKSGGAIKSRLALLMGDASYSLYLTHAFGAIATVHLARKLQMGWAVNALLVTLCIIGTSIVAVIVYRYVEIPLTQFLKQNFAGQRRAKPVPATAS